ncbi:hypothetical protein D3C75_1302520 [compost metagenome]
MQGEDQTMPEGGKHEAPQRVQGSFAQLHAGGSQVGRPFRADRLYVGDMLQLLQ